MKKIFLLTYIVVIVHFARANNYYFSVGSGDDSRTPAQAQSKATPWASYAKLNSFFSSLLPGDSCLFKRGETFYTLSTLTLNKSGTSGNPIVIGAYGIGSQPIITGLVNLTFVSLGSNLWRSNETITGTTLNLLTVNNIPHERGRWPNRSAGNNGYNTIQNSTTNTITQTTGTELSGQPLIYPGSEIFYRPEKFWIDREQIRGYNSGTKIITFALSSGDRPPKTGFGYFVQNDSLTLDEQGEWFYSHGKIKMYSVGSPSNVAAAGVKVFVYGNARSYITFDNITFNGCDSDAIRLSGGQNISIQNCTVENIGRNGIKHSTNYCSILNNSILWALSNGILIEGGAYAPIINYNTIANTGQLIGHNTGNVQDGHGASSGIAISCINPGKFLEIGWNQITNSAYNGISLREWDSGYVHDNFIDSVNNIMHDGGGIYTYKGSDSRSGGVCRIIGNIILDGIGAPAGGGNQLIPGQGVAGIYHDISSNDCFDSANYISRFGQGMLLNFGSIHITVKGNTFFNNSINGIQINTRRKMGDSSRNLAITENVVIARLTSQRTLMTFSADGDPLNRFGVIDYNIYARPLDDNYTMSYQSGAQVNANLPGWKSHYSGYDQHSSRSLFTYSSLQHLTDSTTVYINNSTSPGVVNVADTSQDMHGNVYAGYTPLAAGRVLFLNKTGSSVPISDPPNPPDPPGPLSTQNILYSRFQILVL